MEGQIVDVEYEDGDVDICRIIEDHITECVVEALEYDLSRNMYTFCGMTTIIPKESISGFYDVTELEDTGLYRLTDDGCYYERLDDSDSDYDFSSGDEVSSESDISLCDEME